MDRSTKLLTVVTMFAVTLGILLVFLGFSSSAVPQSKPVSPPVQQETKVQQSSSSATLGIEGQKAYVTKVVDGDTIDVTIAGKDFKVRFVGMDTPETVDPRRPVGCFGKEASNETKSLLTGKTVILQKDVSETDKYGRILRYIYLPLEDGKYLFVNDFLVREGFAKVYTYPPDVKFDKQFTEAQKEATENKRGMWASCN